MEVVSYALHLLLGYFWLEGHLQEVGLVTIGQLGQGDTLGWSRGSLYWSAAAKELA